MRRSIGKCHRYVSFTVALVMGGAAFFLGAVSPSASSAGAELAVAATDSGENACHQATESENSHQILFVGCAGFLP